MENIAEYRVCQIKKIQGSSFFANETLSEAQAIAQDIVNTRMLASDPV